MEFLTVRPVFGCFCRDGANTMTRFFRIGDRVKARGQRWRVADVRSYDRCQLLTLVGIDDANVGVEAPLLTPFDMPTPLVSRRRVRRVGRITWRHACRRLLAAAGPAGILHTAASARMDLLPHQLEPALAIVRGLGSRVLVADEVGLGKTVQAMLVAKELIARGAVTRVLVLTPAGLRDQWTEECRTRFDLPVTLVDAEALRGRKTLLAPGVNPWITEPFVVSSLDYVKRREVLPAVRACQWDLVIIDEAHHGAGGRDRHQAAASLASRAPYVLLLTGTPHNGDPDAFASLCRLGEHNDGLLVFRRTRRDIGMACDRRVHVLAVRSSDAERRMHASLALFMRAVEREHGAAGAGVQLALSTLQKRALSGAFPLAESVARRLRHLEPGGIAPVEQLALPLADPADDIDAEDAVPSWTIPPLLDAREERRLLTALYAAAREAVRHESKLAALSRLLRRLREPVLLFTEYRDTLDHVRATVVPGAAVIHGGMSRRDRIAALAAFPAQGVLLATDAAGEGLNLQHRCRLVVNLELPWNPVRLEHRIGRVDRIGQRGRVHVFHLVAAGAAEARFRRRLEERIARARAAVGGSDPLAVASIHRAAAAPPTSGLRLAIEARDEHERLVRARRLLAVPPRSHRAQRQPQHHLPDAVTLVVFSRRTRLRTALHDQVLVLVQSILADEAGRIVASHLTPVLAPKTVDVKHAIDELLARPWHIPDVARSHWLEVSRRTHQAFWTARLRRELAIGREGPGTAPPRQPGLFDRRAEAEHGEWTRRQLEGRLDAAERERAVRRAGTIVEPAPRPALVLVP